ncbi:TIGR03905 family TSCPD domain-containing protein [Candidatus Soleaferrea massiliensis]|uniref:TIGR03905 family TSCPD domain-containing protein n=1 Tax=Candidatus Soleaferrea massiliensis TaxID=1470354 RepID=UPI0005909EB2|nr:TIGR03905 family TSCPD domain-containing protein [Candidatus Soleaferrea massiliensis]
MQYHYKPRGVCSREIILDVEDHIIQDVQFIGGCHGNAQGVAALCRGRRADEVISLLSGIRCGAKNTSCPAQLALALQETEK